MRQVLLLLSWCVLARAQFGFGGFGGDDAGGVLGGVGGVVSQVQNVTKLATGCFTNEYGYKCCSRVLSTFLTVTFKAPLVETLLDASNLQMVVDTVLGMVQKNFKTSFEIVLSSTDFASKNSFRGDLMCKTQTPKGKVILVYATPVPYSTVLGENRPLTQEEIKLSHFPGNLLEVSAINL